MVRYRTPVKGKYSAKRTRLGNLLVGRRKGKTTLRVARDMQSTSNLFKGTRKVKHFKSSERHALESQEKKSER